MHKENYYLDRRRNNMRRYGITLEEYTELLDKQGGVCAICKNPETLSIKGKTVNLSIDHCHETGLVRGLLCRSCNVGLGNFRDDTRLLETAISYLTGAITCISDEGSDCLE